MGRTEERVPNEVTIVNVANKNHLFSSYFQFTASRALGVEEHWPPCATTAGSISIEAFRQVPTSGTIIDATGVATSVLCLLPAGCVSGTSSE
jgi:hypothetical protein